MAVVVGGGGRAREYISVAENLGASNFEVDVIGIELTRVNALLFAYALGELAYKPIPKSLGDLLRGLSYLDDKVLVLGGLIPGQSTLAVAALVAEAMKADLIVYATTVDGVYTADPAVDPSARLLKRVDVKNLIEMLSSSCAKPGTYKLFDLVSLKIIERSKIPVRVVNGYDPENILRVVLGGEDLGSLVTP